MYGKKDKVGDGSLPHARVHRKSVIAMAGARGAQRVETCGCRMDGYFDLDERAEGGKKELSVTRLPVFPPEKETFRAHAFVLRST